jgi:hypothetical protein
MEHLHNWTGSEVSTAGNPVVQISRNFFRNRPFAQWLQADFFVTGV